MSKQYAPINDEHIIQNRVMISSNDYDSNDFKELHSYKKMIEFISQPTNDMVDVDEGYAPMSMDAFIDYHRKNSTDSDIIKNDYNLDPNLPTLDNKEI